MRPWKPPAARATSALLLLCALPQLMAWLIGPEAGPSLAFAAGLVPARLTGHVAVPEGALPPWLTLVSHMFVHGGLFHLFMNLLFLAWVGRHSEWLIGPARLLLLFLAGGVVGGLFQVIADPASVVPVVGASGGVSAVFGTYALLYARVGEAPATVLGLRLSGELVRALRYAALFVGLQLLVAVAFNSAGGPGIAIWAHIGGFLAGLLFGLPYVWSRDERDFR
ncbi:MAG: rhomboid family intramembrane serine protease [Thermaurantiacus tibetensis]|uniref:rhomboid family intramembrane serine protease n=1 Tax=Thermaurantiacus tibetensis TaxID=2759035 RepID=UPI00189063F5|nr:rhomboid family intramembrane serine protease [Thermaurantiacus tibetensis]